MPSNLFEINKLLDETLEQVNHWKCDGKTYALTDPDVPSLVSARRVATKRIEDIKRHYEMVGGSISYLGTIPKMCEEGIEATLFALKGS